MKVAELKQRGPTMVKLVKLAIAVAFVAPVAIATIAESSAAPSAHANALKAPLLTEVVYRGGYFYDGYGPYAYRPVYTYEGYTVWYPAAAYPGAYYYSGW
jgi:hypothetical protein